MDNSILAAIISATTSIVVALIGKLKSVSRKGDMGKKSIIDYQINEQKFLRNNKTWNFIFVLYSVWIVIAALFMHWDLAGMSYFGILILIIISIIYPINPFKATSLTLFINPVALYLECLLVGVKLQV